MACGLTPNLRSSIALVIVVITVVMMLAAIERDEARGFGKDVAALVDCAEYDRVRTFVREHEGLSIGQPRALVDPVLIAEIPTLVDVENDQHRGLEIALLVA